MEEIKQLIVEMQENLKRNYRLFRYHILLICEDAENGIYLSKNEFERILDRLLDYAFHINVEEEFELMKSAYIAIYPDSVEQYIIYYKDLFADVEEE